MFCVFLNVRYANPKLMHVGHQYVASNFDPSTLKTLVLLMHITYLPIRDLVSLLLITRQILKSTLPF